jgi:transposase
MSISDDQRNILYNMIEWDDEESSFRAKIILFKDDGYTFPEIRMTTNHHYANIRKWIHRFNEKGIEGIISRKHLHKPIKISDNMELSFVIKHLLTEIISNKD